MVVPVSSSSRKWENPDEMDLDEVGVRLHPIFAQPALIGWSYYSKYEYNMHIHVPLTASVTSHLRVPSSLLGPL